MTSFTAQTRTSRKRRGHLNSTRRKQVTMNLLKRDGPLCHYCQIKMLPNGAERVNETMTREHIIPICFGGGNTQDNMVLCCNKCNNERGDQMYWCSCDFCEAAYKRWEAN